MIHALLSAVLLCAAPAQVQPNLKPNPRPDSLPAPQPAAPLASKYFCPMKCEGETTYGEPGRCPICKMRLKPVPSLSNLSVEIKEPKSKEAKAKAPVPLVLSVSGELAPTPGAKADILVLSTNLDAVAHLSPTVTPDNSLSFTHTFTHADMFTILLMPPASQGMFNTAATAPILITGGTHPTPNPIPPAGTPAFLDSGYTILPSTPMVESGKDTSLDFSISVGNSIVPALDPTKVRLFLITTSFKSAATLFPTIEADRLHFTLNSPPPDRYICILEFTSDGKIKTAITNIEARPGAFKPPQP